MFLPLRNLVREPEGKVLLASTATTIGLGTLVYMQLEHWSLIDALYFSVVTLATVGYGDLTPTTDLGKLFTTLYIITGIGILAAFVSELTKFRRVRGRFANRFGLPDETIGEAEAQVDAAVGTGPERDE